jgi:hypothetical protein
MRHPRTSKWRPRGRHHLVIAALGAILLCADAASAQRSTAPATAADSAAAFSDAASAALFGRARAARARTDHSIQSYTALVRSRIGAAMRMPLKDRTLFRQETAARVRWSRSGPHVAQLIAGRSQHPGGVEVPTGISGIGVDDLFDPSQDRLYFGLGGGGRRGRDSAQARSDRAAGDSASAPSDTTDSVEFWIEHPLGDAAERHYRYALGDTLTLRLQDGRTVRVVELRVTPRRDDPHTVRGTLWIHAASGALVQAAFRLARTVDMLRDFEFSDPDDLEDIDRVPGMFKPFEFDVSLMTVEYSLWEMEHWLPRTMRLEGMARAGMFRFPASFDVSYDMEAVVLEGDSASERDAARAVAQEWTSMVDSARVIERRQHRDEIIVIQPRDSLELLHSDQLPPPI